MIDAAYKYLTSHLLTFWQWSDEGESIAWDTGATITFRAELIFVLNRLAPQGLPPLDAVILLLAATRDNWREASAESLYLTGLEGQKQMPLLGNLCAGLEKINALDATLRNTLEARAVLAEIVFDGSKDRLPPRDSAHVVQMLENGLEEDLLAPRLFNSVAKTQPSDQRGALQALHGGLERVDSESLRLRLRTGLNALPEPAALELSTAEQVRALLKSLEGDQELRGLARLARNLMAAVSLPRAVSDSEELPIGGVSDITNRGPLDRLLLSELAHDDLVLAVRVAVNEALYLRREAPPRTPTRQRAVLLDSGLRAWGVPRVFAAAVGLALAATTDRHTESVLYRAEGRRVERVTLSSREGLVAHLAALEPDLHPGQALRAFRQAADEAAGAVEQVLVTTEDVFADAEFQAALTASELGPLHLITLNRAGRFRLLENSVQGVKLVREAQLDLAELFAEPSRDASSLIDPELAADLPAICLVEPFPLLLSHRLDSKRMWLLDRERALAITSDRRLMLWSQSGRGAQQISATLPNGVLWWQGHTPGAALARAVVGYLDVHGLHLLQIDLEGLHCDVQKLPIERGAKAICGHQGALFALYSSGRVLVLSAASGELIHELNLPVDITWQRDRFFFARNQGCWYVLGFDGRTARLEPVFSEEQAKRLPQLLTLFEQPGVDGAIGVTARGDLYSSATGNVRTVGHKLTPPLNIFNITPDGQHVVLSEDTPAESSAAWRKKMCVVNVTTLDVQNIASSDPRAQIAPYRFIQTLDLRHRFRGIFVDSEGVLTLISNKHRRLGIVFDMMSKNLCLRERPMNPNDLRPMVSFEPCPTPCESAGVVGYSLAVAAWEDGSRAYLDSRGLLHLKSADPTLPETSLVLMNGELSGWCSDGRWWGKSYFIGEHQVTAHREIFDTAIRPFVERLG